MSTESFIKAFKRHHPEVSGEVTLYHPEEGQNIILIDGHDAANSFMYPDAMLDFMETQWTRLDDNKLLEDVERLLDL